MCRHLAAVGTRVRVDELLFEAPHALVNQARAPKLQLWGDDNPDGFGAAWYRPGDISEPFRYRTTTPMWTDQSFREEAEGLEAGVVVAAARLRSPGSPVEEEAVAPLRDGKWLCSLNGIVEGFHGDVGSALRDRLPQRRRDALRSQSDTEVCFGLILERIHMGLAPETALAEHILELESMTSGVFNFLLADHRRVIASAVGNSLFVRRDPTVIASEPLDDDPAWEQVDNRTILIADREGVDVIPLDDLTMPDVSTAPV